MKRSEYQKPTMEIVKLQHHHQIMTGSDYDSQAGVQNYGWQTVTEE